MFEQFRPYRQWIVPVLLLVATLAVAHFEPFLSSITL